MWIGTPAFLAALAMSSGSRPLDDRPSVSRMIAAGGGFSPGRAGWRAAASASARPSPIAVPPSGLDAGRGPRGSAWRSRRGTCTSCARWLKKTAPTRTSSGTSSRKRFGRRRRRLEAVRLDVGRRHRARVVGRRARPSPARSGPRPSPAAARARPRARSPRSRRAPSGDVAAEAGVARRDRGASAGARERGAARRAPTRIQHVEQRSPRRPRAGRAARQRAANDKASLRDLARAGSPSVTVTVALAAAADHGDLDLVAGLVRADDADHVVGRGRPACRRSRRSGRRRAVGGSTP